MSTFGLRTSLIAFAAFVGLALTTNPAFARTEAAVTAAAEAVLTAAADLMAVAIAGFKDVLGAARYEDVADILLFDAKPPLRPDALPGGNGLAFDWALIADRPWRTPWMLSGGLTAELLPQAVRISGAAAVDVSSGVESRPGVKDLDKIRAFLAAAGTL